MLRTFRPLGLATLLLAAAPVAASAGHTIRSGAEEPITGDGHQVTQARPFAGATAIRLEGAVDVEVEVGGPPALSVTIDENLQPRLETRLEGETLVVSSRGMRFDGEAVVRVTLPALRHLDLEGSGRIRVRGGAGDTTLRLAGSGDLDWAGAAGALEAELSGSGAIRLEGRARSLRVRLGGSGDVGAAGLVAADADVEIAGSGDVEVTLDGGLLRAGISGSGDIVWGGTVRSERSAVTGSGRIRHR